jgi:pyrimidine-nucleoside phosphorylase
VRAYDIIKKKRDGYPLNREEISFMINGYASGAVPDYQMAALAMAIFFQGMSDEETLDLTRAMMNSGNILSLAGIPGCKVDKHSTGGVGDKTTLVLAPLLAAAGLPVVKLSGRGLGHTGGTVDKLEAIPGFETALSGKRLIDQVMRIGVAIAEQTADLVPADKKLYALRDVTATVDSIPLIAASIMSKKLAAGADVILLDVKVGSGAFMKKLKEACDLGEKMVRIGTGAGRTTAALLTAMDQPLGRTVGNALEVAEAIEVLRGEGPEDLQELCLALGSYMFFLAGRVDGQEQGKELAKELLTSGRALQKFKELIEAQNGSGAVVEDLNLLPAAKHKIPIRASGKGWVHRLEAEPVGLGAMYLGAGRETAKSVIDPAAGVRLFKKIGDHVDAGDILAEIHTALVPGSPVVNRVTGMIKGAYHLDSRPVNSPKIILGYIDPGGARFC